MQPLGRAESCLLWLQETCPSFSFSANQRLVEAGLPANSGASALNAPDGRFPFKTRPFDKLDSIASNYPSPLVSRRLGSRRPNACMQKAAVKPLTSGFKST
jgi:hypothetical protein